ncbi:MAG: YdeI/OmpD-associated family protein [Bacteroidota bacterium]
MNPQFFESSADLHQWFRSFHQTEEELWVGIYKKESGRPTVSWEEVKIEIICFGWAEGKILPIDDKSFAIRLTPRKSKSRWSLTNVEKANLLLDTGLMVEAGIKAFEERDLAYEEELKAQKSILSLSPEFERALQAQPKAWHYFETVAPSYKKQVIRWVMSAKQEATRQKRLQILIESSKEGQKVPPFRPRKSK